MGVLAVRPGSAITACVWLTHRSQMYTCGTPIITLTCFLLFPQNEHHTRSPEPGTRPLYPVTSTEKRLTCIDGGSPRAFWAWPLAWPSPSGPLGRQRSPALKGGS